VLYKVTHNSNVYLFFLLELNSTGKVEIFKKNFILFYFIFFEGEREEIFLAIEQDTDAVTFTMILYFLW